MNMPSVQNVLLYASCNKSVFLIVQCPVKNNIRSFVFEKLYVQT